MQQAANTVHTKYPSTHIIEEEEEKLYLLCASVATLYLSQHRASNPYGD